MATRGGADCTQRYIVLIGILYSSSPGTALWRYARGARRLAGISAAAFGGAAGVARRRTVAHMVSHCYYAALRQHSPTCGGTRWCSAACRSPSETRWRCAVALGCPRCTQWHSVGQGGSQCTRRHAPATLGARRRVGTRRYSAVLGVARGWARARGGMHRDTRWRAVVLMSVGGNWHSTALSSTQRRARGGAVARIVARRRFCSARWLSGTRWNAVASRSDTARWRSVARRCVHLVALSGIRWHSAAGVGLRGRFGASQKPAGWALAALQRRSALDRHWLAWLAAQHTAAPGGAR
jgi:hypothetical protein